MKNLNNQGWKFVGLTLLISTIPYYFIIAGAGIESSFTLLLMWAPALAGIIMRLINREGLFTGLDWNPLKSWRLLLAAVLIPLAIELATLVGTMWLGGAELVQDFMSIEGGKISIRGTAMLFGTGLQAWYIFIPNYLLSYFTGVLYYSLLFAFGEEYCWRGYLQKQWASDNSKTIGFVAIGIIWGLWHLPGILFGHNFPEYPLLGGLVLMPLLCTMFSFTFGIFFNRRYAIWVPTIFHGAVNISGEISNIALAEGSIVKPLYDSIYFGLWIIVATVIAGKHFIRTGAWKRAPESRA